MSKLNKGMFSSNNQKWETPQELFDKLNNVFNSGLIFTAAQRSLDAFISKMKEGIDYVMEFDKRLTNMKMITGQNEQQILKATLLPKASQICGV